MEDLLVADPARRLPAAPREAARSARRDAVARQQPRQYGFRSPQSGPQHGRGSESGAIANNRRSSLARTQ